MGTGTEKGLNLRPVRGNVASGKTVQAQREIKLATRDQGKPEIVRKYNKREAELCQSRLQEIPVLHLLCVHKVECLSKLLCKIKHRPGGGVRKMLFQPTGANRSKGNSHASFHDIHPRLPRPRLPTSSSTKHNLPRPTSRQEKRIRSSGRTTTRRRALLTPT